MEELVRQIKQQLSDPEEIPVIYEDETEEEEEALPRGAPAKAGVSAGAAPGS